MGRFFAFVLALREIGASTANLVLMSFGESLSPNRGWIVSDFKSLPEHFFDRRDFPCAATGSLAEAHAAK
jgi:hypothetical protein